MSKVRKTYETKQEDGWWVASTPAVDRDKDRVIPLGLDLANYRNNPVIVWAHDYRSPHSIIGRAVEMQVSDHDFRIKPEWREPASESDPMHIIRSLIDAKLARALSIGFNPVEYVENETGGMDYTRAEVLEVSLVPVPANQEALRLAVKALGDGDDFPTLADIARITTAQEEEQDANEGRFEAAQRGVDEDTAETEEVQAEAQAPEPVDEPAPVQAEAAGNEAANNKPTPEEMGQFVEVLATWFETIREALT